MQQELVRDRFESERGGALDRALRLVFSLALAAVLVPSLAFGAYSLADQAVESAQDAVFLAETEELAGSGTQDDPYLIEDVEDWEYFVTAFSSYSGSYVSLTADLDLSDLAEDAIAGSDSKAFSGVFDGGGHTVTIDIDTYSESYQALFAYASGATIQNLTVDGSLSTGHHYSAAIVGSAQNSTLSNLVNKADVSSSRSGYGGVGGVVGDAYNVSIVECANLGDVSASTAGGGRYDYDGYDAIGGVVGCAEGENSISRCYNLGSVTGVATRAGGIIGEAIMLDDGESTAIVDCYNRGEVCYTYTGDSIRYRGFYGGIVGLARTTWENLSVTNCYDSAEVSVDSEVGYCGAILGGATDTAFDPSAVDFTNNYFLEGACSWAISGYYGDEDTWLSELEGGAEARTEEEFKTAGFADVLGGSYADDDGETLFNEGWPYLRWQDAEASYRAALIVTLASDANESEDNAISVRILDADGNDVTESFTQAEGATSSSATWSLDGLSLGASYSYTVSKTGYETATGTIEIVEGSVDVQVALQPTAYSYTLTVSPADAEVAFSVDGEELAPASTSTDEAAGTQTLVYEGLYNCNALSCTVERYGYTSQTVDLGSLSFADGAGAVTLAALPTSTASFDVELGEANDDYSDLGVDLDPLVVIYCMDEDSEEYKQMVYDSRESLVAPVQNADGSWSFSAEGLLDGDYLYAAYAFGYETQTGEFAVEGADVGEELALSASSTDPWDGETVDFDWYLFSDSETDYYISSAAELAGLSALVGGEGYDYAGLPFDEDNFAGKTVHLLADLDLGGAEDDPAWWTPIGAGMCVYDYSDEVQDDVFAGTFDGGGCTIENLLVGEGNDSPLHQHGTGNGLFSALVGSEDGPALVEDLVIRNAVIGQDANNANSGSTHGAGAVTGWASNAQISDVKVVGGEVSYELQRTGGVVGSARYTTVSDCLNTASVTSSDSYLGGVLGYAYASTIERCGNEGAVTGTEVQPNGDEGLGGIVGSVALTYSSEDLTLVDSCYNAGDLEGAVASVGGIVGATSTLATWLQISNCYNVGSVVNDAETAGTYGANAGGIIGYACTESLYPDDLAAGESAGDGAFVMVDCYNAGEVVREVSDVMNTHAGALVGLCNYDAMWTEETALNNYYDEDVAGGLGGIGKNGHYTSSEEDVDIEGALEPRSTEEMKAADFVDVLGEAYVADYEGDLALNEGYPLLEWQAEGAQWINGAEASAIADQSYTGEAVEPALTVTLDGEELQEGVDYELVYSDNVDAGTATVTVVGLGLYSGSLSLEFTILPADLADRAEVADIFQQTYTGTYIMPAVSVTDGDAELVEGVDYTIEYADNVDVGTATVTLTGIGNYTGSTSANFQIVQADIADATIGEIADAVYDGAEQTPALSISYGGIELVEGEDYELAFDGNVEVGEAGVTITGIGNFTGVAVVGFDIVAADIAEAEAGEIEEQTYTGAAIEPGLLLSFGGATLVEGEDYTLDYADNVDVGTASVTVTGIGNFTGTATVSFAIAAAELTGASVVLDGESFSYTGEAIEPAATVTLDGASLVEGEDYTVSYSDNMEAGTASVTITGIGNYTGTATTGFTIAAADLSEATLALEGESFSYTGEAIEPAATVTLDGATLVEGEDYAIEYANNVDAGTAIVGVTGIGNYTGELTASFEIAAADLAGASISAIASQSYTGEALEPAVSVAMGLTELVLGEDYTVSYSDNVEAGTATVTITGIGNYTGTATASFTITAADLSEATLALEGDSFTYTGEALEPAATVTLGGATLVEGEDYAIEYSDNVEAGTATVTVTGTGNYAGTVSSSFTIEAADLGGATISLESDSFTYTGAALEPSVAVTASDGTALVEGEDYTVAYADNVEAGTATVTVTGTGNYTGTATTGFTIEAADLSGATVSLESESYEYTGEAIEPAVTVTLGGAALVEGEDYTVAYADNVEAGTATVTVTGTGNYTGTLTASFTIEAPAAEEEPEAEEGAEGGEEESTEPEAPEAGEGDDGEGSDADEGSSSEEGSEDAGDSSDAEADDSEDAGDSSEPDAEGEEAAASEAGDSEAGDSEAGDSTGRSYFIDVPASDSDKWYFDAIYALVDLDYINGYPNNYYGVGDTMTRAQFVTILWRIACPEDYAAYDNVAANESGLSDVSADLYYTAAVNWAVENEVVTGYTNGKFMPNQEISFEQMCLIIARYAGAADGSYEAMTDGLATAELSDFSDADEVSGYARRGLAWCVDEGLVSGNTDGTLAPKEDVTRERAATVIYRGVEQGLLGEE